MHDQAVAGGDLGAVDGAEGFARPVGANDVLGAALSGLAAGHAVGARSAVLAENGQGHGLEERDLADRAVTAAVLPGTAGAPSDGEAVETHGVTLLQDLGVGDPGIGHVRVHGIGSVEAGPRPAAAADGLVVAEPVRAEERVVHRALAARAHAKRSKQRVDDPLGRLDVAAAHGRRQAGVIGELGVQHATGNPDVDGPHDALIKRKGLILENLRND